jgi:hypothetical protein
MVRTPTKQLIVLRKQYWVNSSKNIKISFTKNLLLDAIPKYCLFSLNVPIHSSQNLALIVILILLLM